MVTDKKRIMLMFYLLANAKEELTSLALAEFIGVSVRTIKMDFKELEAFAQQHGCYLVSKRGLGYKLIVFDLALYKSLKEQLDIRYSSIAHAKPELLSRTNDVLRQLFSEDHYVKLDSLGDELFLSRSAINNEMNQVKSFLDTFQLQLVTKPHHGVRIEGNEFYMRLCMVELFELHFDRAISTLKFNRYRDFFTMEPTKRQLIRQELLKVLRSSNNSIIDSFVNRIAIYLILMRNRYYKGYRMHFDEKTISYVKQYHEYNLAYQLVEQLANNHGFIMDENEVIGIAILLLIWTDLTDQDDCLSRYPIQYREANDLADQIAIDLHQRWNLNGDDFEMFNTKLIPILIPILWHIRWGLSNIKILGPLAEGNSVHSSPMCVTLATTVAQYIEQHYQCQLSNFCKNLIAIRFADILENISYDYTPQSIIICSRNGRQAAETIKKKLLKKIDPLWFKTVEVMAFYEVRRKNLKDYDFILLNIPNYTYRYSVPFIEIKNSLDHTELDEIYERIILNGYQIKPLVQKLECSVVFMDLQTNINSIESFIDLVSYRCCDNVSSILTIKSYLTAIVDICIYNKTAVMIVDRKLTKQSFFEIYRFKKSCLWQNKEVKNILFLSVQLSEGYKTAKMLDDLLHGLMVDSDALEKLIECGSEETMEEIVKRRLSS